MFVVVVGVLLAGCNGNTNAAPKPSPTVKRHMNASDIINPGGTNLRYVDKQLAAWNAMTPHDQDILCAMSSKELGEAFGKMMIEKGAVNADAAELAVTTTKIVVSACGDVRP